MSISKISSRTFLISLISLDASAHAKNVVALTNINPQIFECLRDAHTPKEKTLNVLLEVVNTLRESDSKDVAKEKLEFWIKNKAYVQGDSKTERAMRYIMEQLFGAKFPQTSLRTAYGLPWQKMKGMLIFDGFSPKVRVQGQTFRIAFEYDGEQHDNHIKFFHEYEKDYRRLQMSDAAKNYYASKSEYKTILIRLKEIDKFHYNTLQNFEAEIIKQFKEQTGIEIQRKNISPNLLFNLD